MKRFESEEFKARRHECSRTAQHILDFLGNVAEHAGSDVEPPTFEVRGVGITYWTGGRRFCRFDPKPQADHVWAMVPGGDRAALAAVGTVSDRSDGPWVTIKTMHGAVRLVPEILRAYDAATQEPAKRG